MLAIMLWTTLPVSLEAQETVGPFDFFNVWCLRDDPDFDRIHSAAAGRGWAELSPQVLSVLSPLVDPDASKGWIASDDDHPMRVLVITKATSGKKTVNACTVGASKIDTVAFEKEVATKLGIEPQAEERDAERIYKKFLIRHAGKEELITLSLPLKVQELGDVVASAIEVGQ